MYRCLGDRIIGGGETGAWDLERGAEGMINLRAVCSRGSNRAFVGACFAGSWAALLLTAGTWRSAGALWGWLGVEPQRDAQGWARGGGGGGGGGGNLLLSFRR